MGKYLRKETRLTNPDAQSGKFRRDCHGKKRYHDIEQAKKALQRIRENPRDVAPHRPYRCHICKGWHLSSKEEH